MYLLETKVGSQFFPRIQVEYGNSYAYGQILPLELPTLYLHDIYSEVPRLGVGRMMLRAFIQTGMNQDAESFAAGIVTDAGARFFSRILEGSEIKIEKGQSLSVPIVEIARLLDLG